MQADGIPSGQRDFLQRVHTFWSTHRQSPTVRELMALMGVRSTNAVGCQLTALRKKGLLVVPARISARNIELTAAGRRAIGAPCCGCKACLCSCHASSAKRERRQALDQADQEVLQAADAWEDNPSAFERLVMAVHRRRALMREEPARS